MTRWLRPEWTLIAFLWVCYVLNHADRQVVYTLFPALQKEFAFSDVMVSMTGALFLWVYGFMSPVAGILGDRWSRTRLVAGSLAIWSLFTVLSGLAPNGWFLLACRALLGVSESLFMPAAYALMANAHGPETRSRAIAIFGTSQMAGVAAGGTLSGYIAQHYHWRYAFWMLGGIGLLFVWPLLRYFRGLPAQFGAMPDLAGKPAGLASFGALFRIPTLRVVTAFVAIATFGLYLVYTWLPTFLFDKFSLGLAAAGFEASVYPQIGTIAGLLAGGASADRFYGRSHRARFWVVLAGFLMAAPCIFAIGAAPSLAVTRFAGMGFGFASGFVISNQVAAAFEVVPASLRASTVGILNLLGCLVSGFAPFLGGVARKSFGLQQLMAFTAVLYLLTAALIVYGTLRHFDRDHARAQEL